MRLGRLGKTHICTDVHQAVVTCEVLLVVRDLSCAVEHADMVREVHLQ